MERGGNSRKKVEDGHVWTLQTKKKASLDASIAQIQRHKAFQGYSGYVSYNPFIVIWWLTWCPYSL